MVLSACKARHQRLKAIQLLEDIRSKQPLSGEEQFLLVQLYELVGDWTKARHLLAFQQNKSGEALELRNQALALVELLPELVDTRAVIRLQMGQAQQAVHDLGAAVAEAPQAALCYHLAQAYQLANNRRAAPESLRRAKGLGPRPDQIHALERAAYSQLHADLESR